MDGPSSHGAAYDAYQVFPLEE